MNRVIARAIHETTNATYWMENPEWQSGNPVGDLALRGIRRLPFSIHELQKSMIFNHAPAVTVSGESVVVIGDETVKKYMFRYPGIMGPDDFYVNVLNEVDAVTRTLANSALATTVSIEEATIFKRPFGSAEAVTQTQDKINLVANPAISTEDLRRDATPQSNKTARDLDILLSNVQKLAKDYNYYPDLAFSSSNLRRNSETGGLTLIDVMPIHADGTRLIGDSPSKLPHTIEAIDAMKIFVGRFGA
jgi:hypothetical protein